MEKRYCMSDPRGHEAALFPPASEKGPDQLILPGSWEPTQHTSRRLKPPPPQPHRKTYLPAWRWDGRVGGGSKGGDICTVVAIHIVVWQEPTQHCGTVISN